MKEKRVVVLAVILLGLVGVYIWHSAKIANESRPTGKPLDIAKLDPNLALKAKVGKAVHRYLKKHGKVPQGLAELKGKYLDEATYNQAVAKKLRYVALDQKTYRLRYPERGKPPVRLAAKKSVAVAKAGKSSGAAATSLGSGSLTTIQTGWQYSPKGRPDPFKPFIVARRAETAVAPKVKKRPLTPLQKMPLSEIQSGLKAIVWGEMGSKALVQDATGKGYVLAVGTYVGQNDGVVKKILPDRIVVEEYRRDPIENRLVTNEVVLKLRKGEEEQ
ncbi:MAG: pilus assembly protein PilP [Deltaproteobacteria bacterium]|nr:pilus assembly protein PilP [Deltaproteobacteria bacterium]MBW2069646.1 pilus assembly protein PilP [Deltaproteobacteria bacterium]